MGKVLGIVNRKGGVGKTTTATTLSYLLSKEGCKVALIDFDGQRHTTKLCGVTAPEQLSVTIYDILKCIVMNEELPDKGSYMIRTETGVDLIPANNKLDNFDKLMCDTDFAEYKLKEFVDTIKEQYDYILIDSPAGLGAGFRLAICGADRALVIATNDASSLRDAQRTVCELESIRQVHLIMNRIQPKLLRKLRATIDDAMNTAGLPLIGVVPEDDQVMLAANLGQPLTAQGRRGAALACWNIALRLDGNQVPIMRIR